MPTSVAGFMAPKSLKRGCLGTAAPSPRSESTTLPCADSRTPPRRSNVSAGARLISSNRIHRPSLSAVTSAPSTNANTGPPPWPHARSAVDSSRSNWRQSATRSSGSARFFFPSGVGSSSSWAAAFFPFAFFSRLRLAGFFSSTSSCFSSSSSAAAASFATLSTPARIACSRCVHFLFSPYRTTLFMNSAFAADGKVFSKTDLNFGSSGRHRCLAPAGLNPPRKSADSDWFERFTTVNGAPVTRASCCTRAVLPVPVSPTSSTGSVICTAAATRSRILIAWPVFAHRPSSLTTSSLAGRTARPTATPPAPRCMAGLWRTSVCSATSAPRPQHPAMASSTRRRPGPAGSIPPKTSAASSYAARFTFGGSESALVLPARIRESSVRRIFSRRLAHRSRSRRVNGRPAWTLGPPAASASAKDVPSTDEPRTRPLGRSTSTSTSISSVPPSISASISSSNPGRVRSLELFVPPGAAAAPPWPHMRCTTLRVSSIAGASGVSRGCTPHNTSMGSSPAGGSTATRAQRPASGSARAPAAADPPLRPPPTVTVPKSWNPSAAATDSPRPGT